MRRYLKGSEVSLERISPTTLKVTIDSGEIFKNAEPKRLFPMTNQNEYIAFLSEEGKEMAILKSCDGLSFDSRAALDECLSEFYLIPKITKIIDIVGKFGVFSWTVETDRGPRKFEIKNRVSDIKNMPDGRILLRDSDDNRYEITDYQKLDRHSRYLLISEI
jgi:hypothetical protein